MIDLYVMYVLIKCAHFNLLLYNYNVVAAYT